MKRKCILFTVLMLMTMIVHSTNVHHVILIDKTASMVGQGDGNGNIWGLVQKALIAYVESVEEGDDVTLYYFAEKLSSPVRYVNVGVSEKAEMVNYISNITPDGRRTCLYNALNELVVVEYAHSEKNTHQSSKLISIFTDGLNNCNGFSMKDIAEEFKARKGDFDFIYYISLGVKTPNDILDVVDNSNSILIQEVIKPLEEEDILPLILSVIEQEISLTFQHKQRNMLFDLHFEANKELKKEEIAIKVELKRAPDGVRLNQDRTPFMISKDKKTSTLELQLTQEYFSNDAKAELVFTVSSGNAVVSNNRVRVMLTLPKKGNSVINKIRRK